MRIGDFNQSATVSANVQPLASQAAKAYGIRPGERGGPALKLAATQATDSYAASPKIQNLIAGSVKAPVDFDAAGRAAGLRMYTRSADAIEAATGVELGRTIDLKA